MFNQNNQTTNYNNVDIRCGLLMSVRVNCNYIITLYQDYNSEGSYEFTYIGNPKYEEQSTEAFWDEYNTMIANVLAEPHKYREGEMEQELIYRFEECLENWKTNFTMENQEIETEDESEEEEDEEDRILTESESEEEEDEEEIHCKGINGKDCDYCSHIDADDIETIGWVCCETKKWICDKCIDEEEEKEVIEEKDYERFKDMEWYKDKNTGNSLADYTEKVDKDTEGNMITKNVGYIDGDTYCELFNEHHTRTELINIYKEWEDNGEIVEIYEYELSEEAYENSDLGPRDCIMLWTTNLTDNISCNWYNGSSPFAKGLELIDWRDDMDEDIDSEIKVEEIDLDNTQD